MLDLTSEFKNTTLSTNEKLVPIETTLEYLMREHNELKNDYKEADGIYTRYCGEIALKVAARLIAEGKKPVILMITKENRARLKPLVYDGRVSWGNHQVCCADNLGYDPILKEPVNIKEYSMKTFGEETNIDVFYSYEIVLEQVNRLMAIGEITMAKSKG